jgi:hypothetical protein
MAKKTSKKKRVPNPPVATAKVTIARRWSQRLNRWIKAHKRTITLSTTAILALYGAWYAQKIGIDKAEQRLREAQEKTLNKRFAVEGKLASQAFQLGASSKPLQKRQKMLGKVLKSQEKRLRTVEKALTNKDFRKFLKKKGYDDVRRLTK